MSECPEPMSHKYVCKYLHDVVNDHYASIKINPNDFHNIKN